MSTRVDRIVVMSIATAFVVSEPAVRQTPSENLKEYWDSLYIGAGAQIPSRRDFKPSQLSPTTLRQIVIYEIDEEGDLSTRLIGSSLEKIYGTSFATHGPLYSDHAMFQARFDDFLEQLQEGKGWGLVERSVTTNGDVIVNTKTNLFPMRGKQGNIQFLVGVVELDMTNHQAMGLTLSSTQKDLPQTPPKRLALYPFKTGNGREIDLMNISLAETGNGLWTNPVTIS